MSWSLRIFIVSMHRRMFFIVLSKLIKWKIGWSKNKKKIECFAMRIYGLSLTETIIRQKKESKYDKRKREKTMICANVINNRLKLFITVELNEISTWHFENVTSQPLKFMSAWVSDVMMRKTKIGSVPSFHQLLDKNAFPQQQQKHSLN